MSESAWPDGPAVADETDHVGRLARNLVALAGGQVATWSMTLAWTLIVPRAIGPAGLGLLVTGMSVSGVLAIVLGLGTRNYLVREIVLRRAAAPRLVGTAIVLRVAMAPVFAVCVIGYAKVSRMPPDAALVLYLTATSAFLVLIAEPIQAVFQAHERMQYLAYSDVLNKSAQSLIGIALVLAGFRVVGIAANMVLVAGVVVALNAVWVRGTSRIELRTSARLVRDMVRQSVAYWAFGVFSMIYLWIDAIMLSLMTRPEVVGWYGAPTRLFQTLMFVPVLLSTAWLPRLIGAFGGGMEELRKAARRPLELVLLLGAPICAGTAIVARPLVDVLYGPGYHEAVPVLVILGICIPPMYLNILLNQVLLAAKRQVVWTWVMVGATVFNPLVNLVLIPATEARYGNGAIGAALSLLLTEVVMVALGLALVGAAVADRRMVRRCGLAVGASLGMWGAAYAARPLGTAASCVIGAAVFAGLAACSQLVTRAEIAQLREAFSGRHR